MVRAKFFARTALALTLSLGVAAGGFSAAEAKDKKPAAAPAGPAYKPTEKFVKAYVPAAKALEAAIKRADVLAQRQKVADGAQRVNSATGKPAKDAALADMNAQITALQGMLAPEKALVDAAVAAGSNPDDKLISGQLLVNYGNIAIDKNTQKIGLQMQLNSGKLPAETVPLVHFTLGRLAMEVKDYATAQREMKLAVDGGYTKDEAEFFLANSYLLDKQLPMGLRMLHDAIVRNGTASPEYWIDNGVVQAFNNKMPAETNLLAADLVTNYPSKQNWDRAIFTITTINKYNGQEKLDLLRLRDRTNSFQDAADYIDYIVYADPKRLPAEVLRIIDQGTKAGVISASTPIDNLGNTIGKLQLQAKGRLAEDNNLLIIQEKDARGPRADAATVVGAADTFLSHGMFPKAEEMYRLALTKPGVDAGRVNLRLGIALVSQSKFAEAITVFGQVKDARAPIANLWIVYAKQKMAGK